MSQLALAPDEALSAARQPRPTAMLLGIASASFASLLLELSLTRLFSVVLFYHFAFLAVSVALLGLGAGGVFAYLRRAWLERWTVSQLGTRLTLSNSTVIVAALWVVLHVPVSLGLDAHNFLRLTALYLACAVPFFFTGLLFAVVFAREASRVRMLYGADLLGGSAACLAVVPALNWLGGPNAVLLAALIMALSSLIWSRNTEKPELRWRRRGLLLSGLVVAFMAANHSGLLFDVVYAKGWRQDLKLRLFSQWNALSRVEVRQVGDSKYIVIDSDATTAIMNVDPHQWHDTVWEHNLMYAAPAVTNVLRPRGSYAIIGPGGGVDVLRAVANGSSRVVGIEINPIIANTIMRGRFADYAYHLYNIPEVTIHVSDGRSWLRSSHEEFDVVQMTLVDTWASTAAGAFALSENNLYTREAFREYFEHLKPDGLLSITRWEFRRPREALRVVAEAIDALHSLGVRNPAANFIVVSDGKLDEDGRPVTVLARKTPFSSEEEAEVQRHLAENPNLALLYSPGHRQLNPFTDLIAGNHPHAFATTYSYDVAPVDDNAPFFFFTLKTGDMLREVLAGHGRGMDWRINLGVLVLGILLAISIVAVLLFLVVPFLLHSRSEGTRPGIGMVALLYFVAIGLGYIMTEIAFIQRFVLFLGHPTYALTVVVFLMMLSSGMGSIAARRWSIAGNRLLVPLVAIAAVLILDCAVLSSLLAREVGISFLAKLAISAGLLIPLGFCMGIPFPTGLVALNARSSGTNARSSGTAENGIEWAWAMNAASSVLGSVVAMLVAIHYGLNTTLGTAAAAYILAAVAAVASLRQPAPVPLSTA